eukprot:scaffold406753_cov34-Prasinocladus_malaysianus.AAC.1
MLAHSTGPHLKWQKKGLLVLLGWPNATNLNLGDGAGAGWQAGGRRGGRPHALHLHGAASSHRWDRPEAPPARRKHIARRLCARLRPILRLGPGVGRSGSGGGLPAGPAEARGRSRPGWLFARQATAARADSGGLGPG